jgi:hypothetical protein
MKLIKLVKETRYQNAFYQNKQNMKKTWGIVNELTSSISNLVHKGRIYVKTNGSLVSEPDELSEVFNDHFATVKARSLLRKFPILGMVVHTLITGQVKP